MPLTRKRATIWTCSDGNEYADFREAARHELECEIRAYVALKLGTAVCDSFNAGDFADFLIENKEELGAMCVKSQVAFKREAQPADRKTPTYGSDPRDRT